MVAGLGAVHSATTLFPDVTIALPAVSDTLTISAGAATGVEPLCHLVQGSPIPGLWTATGPWPVDNGAVQW